LENKKITGLKSKKAVDVKNQEKPTNLRPSSGMSKVSIDHNINSHIDDEGNKILNKKRTTTNALVNNKSNSNNSVPKIVKSNADDRILVKVNNSEDSNEELETISKLRK